MKKQFLIAFDTICDGWQTALDELGNPTYYNSHDEAFLELFNDATFGLEFQDKELHREMLKLLREGNISKMKAFWVDNPDANYYDDFIIDAEDFILGRKVVLGEDGWKTIGRHVSKTNSERQKKENK